ncbi:hypothetical protein DQ04_01021000, partial [Trypanosoma grayi]|uniref:hypothetical protein n=1 Tax=Trypanosoma grayi TaxID=71804 RepID=UPI0004F459D1
SSSSSSRVESFESSGYFSFWEAEAETSSLCLKQFERRCTIPRCSIQHSCGLFVLRVAKMKGTEPPKVVQGHEVSSIGHKRRLLCQLTILHAISLELPCSTRHALCAINSSSLRTSCGFL